MQIGFVGLGKMGGNMVHRILSGSEQIQVAVTDRSPEPVQDAVKLGAMAADSLEDLVQKLEKPRNIWLMIPSGAPTQETVQKL
ncbi:MAG: 6-phosphogluconate dehydrogenase, partial [Thermoleophilaceae bacterium]|nr:6-phosphogluconate dehydrogenase [Thermoleophilaceae bacterium]